MASSGALRRHIRNYASAGLLASLAGVITFPLLTRSLTVAEYGILGLLSSSLTLFIAFGKLGMQHAIIRFYSQIKNGNDNHNLNEMTSTVVMMFVTLATITTALSVLTGYFLLPYVSEFDNISNLFLIASGIVFLRLLGSGLMNFLRAQQRSAVVAATQILTRYLYLLMVLMVMFFTDMSVAFVLSAMLVAEIIGIGFASRKFGDAWHFKLSEVTPKLGKAMLIYGMPLMMLESLSLVMRVSDRYIIQALLDENALGMYSASYNLASYLDALVLAAMVQALKPFYMQIWESEGAEQTKAFLSKGLHSYLVWGLPVITLFAVVSPYLLNFLASSKYAPGTIIIPFIAFSYLIEGTMHFLAAGLYIKKHTKVLMFWGVVTAVLNLVLNYLTIPHFGILGAAMVTNVCFIIFVAGISIQAFKYLPFELKPTVPMVMAFICALIAYFLHLLDFGNDFANLMFKGMIGFVLFFGAVLVADAQTRDWFFSKLRSLTPDVSK